MSTSPRRRSPPKRVRVQSKKSPSTQKQSRVKILKRDGRVQPYTRVKMVRSIQNAGANKQEAELVANRVSERLQNKESIPSKELSSMVARSLSQVNPTASKNYVNQRNQKLAYTQRVNHLNSEIGGLNQQLNSIPQRIERVNDSIQSLSTRITRIRQNNYRTLTHLESDQTTLSETWNNLSPELRSNASLQSATVQSQLGDLQQMLSSQLRRTDYNLGGLQAIDSRLSGLRLNLSELQGTVSTALTPLEKKLQNIDKDLRKAERTVSLVANAAFPWERDETPVVAVKVKDLENDLDGVVTLTNLRFILEHEKEIILKKRFFIVTEKKVVREVAVQKPIGMVTRLVRGKVGFFKGAGLFVEFAPESRIPDMKLDTNGQDADWVMHSFNAVSSGQVEQELATVTADVSKSDEEPQLVTCHICGAPYTEKIYRGQTSINCKYCGAVVAL
jgi:transcriptional regulator NrdR family protein